MGLINFQFELEKANYLPGENVNGRLIVGLDSEEKMGKIKVTFQGIGEVKFWAKVSGNRRTFHDSENYFIMESVVCNGPDLPAGIHNLPFSFPLPQNVPMTFGSEWGHIKYEVSSQGIFEQRQLYFGNQSLSYSHGENDKHP